MKKTIGILIAFLLFASCNQNNTPQPNNNSGNNNGGNGNNNGNSVSAAHWIPNWKTDTLVGVGIDSFDVIYTLKKGDTSMINYKGGYYYIWAQCPTVNPNNDPDWFEDNAKMYDFVCIGPRAFDTSSIIAGNAFCSVMPPRYYNKAYNTWHAQDFVLMVNPLKPPFPEWVNAGIYSTYYKYLLPH
ncbi:MAG TPA: hypothetical protein VFQ86_05895 [Arachidicoccus soli]|nr:hypothetical protein [Arachidicoccus soli]